MHHLISQVTCSVLILLFVCTYIHIAHSTYPIVDEFKLSLPPHPCLSNNKYNKNNKKTFSIKMKEDVGMSKPKKHANKVGRLT